MITNYWNFFCWNWFVYNLIIEWRCSSYQKMQHGHRWCHWPGFAWCKGNSIHTEILTWWNDELWLCVPCIPQFGVTEKKSITSLQRRCGFRTKPTTCYTTFACMKVYFSKDYFWLLSPMLSFWSMPWLSFGGLVGCQKQRQLCSLLMGGH